MLAVGKKVLKERIIMKNKNGMFGYKENDILTPEEVAQYLRKSTSWVYKNWKELGGRKLGGSLLFPKQEDLYECLFGKKRSNEQGKEDKSNIGLEVRLHSQRREILGTILPNKTRGKGSRGGKEEKDKSTERKTGNNDPNRHQLFGPVKYEA